MRLFSNHRYLSFFFGSFVIFSVAQFVLSQDIEKDPVQLFNRGQDAHEKGDLKAALRLYEEALKIAPQFPEAEFQRGNVLQSLGRESEAEEAFRKAIELRENWILPMSALTEILLRNSKLNEAERLLNKIIELDQGNSNALAGLAELYLKKNVSDDILRAYLQKLSGISNPDAPIFAARGAIEFRLGETESAKKSLERSLAIQPNNAFALVELTNIFVIEKSFDKALLNAENLVKFYPNSTGYRLSLARVFAESGNLDESYKILDSLDVQNPEVIKFRNFLLANTSTDVAALEKQLETDARNSSALRRLCNLTRKTPAKALEYCRRAYEADPTNIEPAIGFGAALVQAKQFQKAVILLRKLLTLDFENYPIHANLATALFELKNYSDAKVEFKWLIKNKPELAVAYYFLAITHDNLQEYTEAHLNYLKFLELADANQNQLEIDKVKLRLPSLEKQIKAGGGKRAKGER